MLEDAVDRPLWKIDAFPPLLAHARRQLQVALYLRLRQRLDSELDAALADHLRLGAVAVDPDFSRVAQELRAVLPHRGARIGRASVSGRKLDCIFA